MNSSGICAAGRYRSGLQRGGLTSCRIGLWRVIETLRTFTSTHAPDFDICCIDDKDKLSNFFSISGDWLVPFTGVSGSSLCPNNTGSDIAASYHTTGTRHSRPRKRRASRTVSTPVTSSQSCHGGIVSRDHGITPVPRVPVTGDRFRGVA